MIYIISTIFFAIIMAFLASTSMIYLSKFKEHIILNKNNFLINILDIIWRILLPLIFGAIYILLPTWIISYFTNKTSIIKSLNFYYICFFVPIFFIIVFILIRLGKIKTKRTLE